MSTAALRCNRQPIIEIEALIGANILVLQFKGDGELVVVTRPTIRAGRTTQDQAARDIGNSKRQPANALQACALQG